MANIQSKGYVPKLEAFFSLNKFPSRADRVFMAKQSGMTLRQINVWVSVSASSLNHGRQITDDSMQSFRTGDHVQKQRSSHEKSAMW